MNKTILQSLFCALLLSFGLTAHAQVTIGSSLIPNEGALLDLKEEDNAIGGETTTKGLLMPRVKLLYSEIQPTKSLAQTIDGNAASEVWNAEEHTGLMIYNVHNDGLYICPGVYVWTSERWLKVDGIACCPSPIITTPTADQTLTTCIGSNITMSVSATDLEGSTLNYVWEKDGYPIPNTSNSLTINNISAKDEGVYKCKVSNDCNMVSERNFNLALISPTLSLVATDICIGSVNVLSATTSKVGLRIKWYDSNNIYLASGLNYTTPSTLPAGNYTYYATAEDPISNCVSNKESVSFTVFAKPTISDIKNGLLNKTTYGYTVSAKASVGSLVRWYDAPTGGNLLAIRNNYTGVTTPQTTRFRLYAEAYNPTTGCTSTREQVWVSPCGAYISPTVWKEFMCHNLGADTSVDPLAYTDYGVSSVDVIGSYYQGHSSLPHATNTGLPIPGIWESYPNYPFVADPCPAGFRMPYPFEMQGIIENNKVTVRGLMGDRIPAVSIGDFLLLPATGFAWLNNGNVNFESRKEDLYYWTATPNFIFHFNRHGGTVRPMPQGYGANKRCIAK